MHVLHAYWLHGWKDIDKNRLIIFQIVSKVPPYACEVCNSRRAVPNLSNTKMKKITENWEMFEHKTCHFYRPRKEKKSLTLNVTNLSFLH